MAVPLQPGLTLDDALAAAGGETRAADLGHVKLSHLNAELQTVDIAKLRQNGETSGVTLQAGDVITVPAMSQQVFLLGAVNHPGPLEFRPGMTLLDALGGAADPGASQSPGGPASQADLYHAIVTHPDGQHTEIDLDKILRQGDAANNINLVAGDTVYIPESKELIYVFGAVAKPGAYVLRDRDKDRLLDALQLAGGTTPSAEVSRAVIVHGAAASKAAVPTNTTPAHLDQLLGHGELQYNVQMAAGDVLYVPERGRPGTLQSILPTLIYVVGHALMF
jgi:protein involved in polysaccharide export with SLBB domain